MRGFIEIVKGLGANNVLGESFGRNVLGESFFFWNHILHLGLGAGQGWAGLGWAGGWAGLAGWAGLGWAGPAGLLGCWAAGVGGLGWDGLGWAGWAGVGWAAGLGCWAAGLLGCWAAGLGCVSNPETEIGLFENETEVGLFANGKLRLHRKKKLPDGQQQQAISIYFFLEGLGFKGLGFRVCARHSISTLAGWACQVEAISSASERAWRHGDWGLVSATSALLPTRAARAAPTLNQLRLLGFSFLNSFFFFLCLANRSSAAMCAVVVSRFLAQPSRPLLRLVG